VELARRRPYHFLHLAAYWCLVLLVVQLDLVLVLHLDLVLVLDLEQVRHLELRLDRLVLGLLGLLLGPLLYFLVYIVNNTLTLTLNRPQCKCFYYIVCLYLDISAYYYTS